MLLIILSGIVRYIELKDSGWDDIDEYKIPDNTNAVGYSTEERTYPGIVVRISNDNVMVVSVSSSDEEYGINLKDLPELKWKFAKNDNVS